MSLSVPDCFSVSLSLSLPLFLSRKLPVREINLSKALTELEMDQTQVIATCINKQLLLVISS